MGSIPGLGRFPGEGIGNPLHHSCLENPMDRGAWRATVHKVTKSRTQMKRLSTHTGPSVSSLILLEDVGIWQQRLPPSMFCNHRLCKLKGKRGMEQEWAIFFFSSFIVGSVYFKQFPKSVVFLLCCCTRGMMHFYENFHLPRPTPYPELAYLEVP